MATFSRGLRPQAFMLLIRPARITPCKPPQPTHLLFRAHLFSSSSRLFTKPPTPRTPKPPIIPEKPAPKASISPALASVHTPPSSYAEQIALKGRTIIYEAPSHFWFRASCYTTGLFCVSYSVYNYWSVYLHPPPDIAWWVPTAFGVICSFMIAMGGYFVMSTNKIVRSIEIIPTNTAYIARHLAKTKASGQSPLYVEIQSQRVGPFLPVKKTIVPLEQVQLPCRMQVFFDPKYGYKQKTPAQLVREQRAELERKKAEREYTMNHLLTAPFRDMGKAIKYAFSGIKRSFDREGFANINVGTQTFKLDVLSGWALENGRAMDRLLPIRPNTVSTRKL
ncbi:hypothetical protein QBC38DRAFT_256754 [Podospora fimiseda]|uniref:Uncharacterized protein n=1 Tax=Podospora fimiseda TaxID=252190 RepID=A0AAN7GW25_9PEZI|nr:hypothetical protein QBC38DRAFT_256754 [Podospora fimiseda]